MLEDVNVVLEHRVHGTFGLLTFDVEMRKKNLDMVKLSCSLHIGMRNRKRKKERMNIDVLERWRHG